VLRTEDGGATWVPVQLPEKVELDSLAALKGGSRAWLSATKCNPDLIAPNGCTRGDEVLFVSDDSGGTWKEISSQTPWGMKFASASTGWALGPSLLRTEDGGKSWRVVRDIAVENKAFADLSVLGEDTLVLVEIDPNTSMQQIVKTTDAGVTWTDAGPPTIAMSALTYFDQQHAIRNNLNQTLQSSDDGGLTWHLSTIPAFSTRFRLAVDFIDQANGWAAGTKLLRTGDGGMSWEAVSDLRFDSLDFVSSAEGWAAHTVCLAGPCQSIVFHSTDGGATWSEQIRQESSDVPRIKFVDRLNGWVTLGRGKPVLHTRDGGLTWSEQQPPGGRLTFVDALTVWSATDPGVTGAGGASVYLSRDGGDSWSPAASLVSQTCSAPNVAAVDAIHAWFVSPECGWTSKSAVLRTVDGGVTWQTVSPTSNGYYQQMAFFTPIDGVAVRVVCPSSPVSSNDECQDQLLRTRDGGDTWTVEVIPPTTRGFEEYQFIDPWHGWRVDTSGGGMMDVEKQIVEIYSVTPPFVTPDTGEGRDESPTTALVALGAFGILLLGAGGIVGIRRRRHG
jgi:LPXTG-motif cell wall-anchored protein